MAPFRSTVDAKLERAIEDGDFIECDFCRRKPGIPILCEGCLHNRRLVGCLQDKIRRKGVVIWTLISALSAAVAFGAIQVLLHAGGAS